MGAEVRTRKRDGIDVLIVYWRDPKGNRHVAFDDDQKMPFGPDTPESRQRAEAVRVLKEPLPELAHTPTLGAWAEKWLKGVKAMVATKRRSSQTLLAYSRFVRYTITDNWLGRMNLDLIQRRNVKEWAEELMLPPEDGGKGWARGTVAGAVKALQRCIAAAIEDSVRTVETNPARNIMKSLSLEPDDLSAEPPSVEVTAALLGVVDAEAHGPFVVMTYLGIRIGEATGLQWCDIDLEKGEAKLVRQVYPSGEVAKLKSNAGYRIVEIPEPAVEILRAMKAKQGREALALGRTPSMWVLGIEPKDNKNARMRLFSAWKRAKKAIGYEGRVWIHGVRHTYGTGRTEAGGEKVMLALKFAMGHANLKTTFDLYAKHAQPRDRQNVEQYGARVAAGVVKFPKVVSDGTA